MHVRLPLEVINSKVIQATHPGPNLCFVQSANSGSRRTELAQCKQRHISGWEEEGQGWGDGPDQAEPSGQLKGGP